MNLQNSNSNLGKFVLHVSEDEEKATNGVP